MTKNGNVLCIEHFVNFSIFCLNEIPIFYLFFKCWIEHVLKTLKMMFKLLKHVLKYVFLGPWKKKRWSRKKKIYISENKCFVIQKFDFYNILKYIIYTKHIKIWNCDFFLIYKIIRIFWSYFKTSEHECCSFRYMMPMSRFWNVLNDTNMGFKTAKIAS